MSFYGASKLKPTSNTSLNTICVHPDGYPFWVRIPLNSQQDQVFQNCINNMLEENIIETQRMIAGILKQKGIYATSCSFSRSFYSSCSELREWSDI
jgi:hypothetical protein